MINLQRQITLLPLRLVSTKQTEQTGAAVQSCAAGEAGGGSPPPLPEVVVEGTAKKCLEEPLSSDNLFIAPPLQAGPDVAKPAAKESSGEKRGRRTIQNAALIECEGEYCAPYEELPGPAFPKAVNKLLSFLPLIGTQLTISFIHRTHLYIGRAGKRVKWLLKLRPYHNLFEEYGPVVRVAAPLGGELVIVRRLADTRAVLHSPSQSLSSSSSVLDSLEAYRKLKAPLHVPMTVAIGAVNDWTKLRERYQNNLDFQVKEFFKLQEQISDELINKLYSGRNMQDEVTDEFRTNLYKWGLECMTRTMFDKERELVKGGGGGEGRGGSLTESGRLLAAVMAGSEGLSSCETGLQLWRMFPTPGWNKLVNSCDILEGLLCRNLRMAYMRLDSIAKGPEAVSEAPSFLEAAILKHSIPPEQMLTKLLDIFLLGVNVAVNIVSFVLYHLAKYPRVQNKLFKEVLEYVPHTDCELQSSEMDKMKYLMACIVETIRLTNPFPFTTKLLEKDVVIHGYKVPKGWAGVEKARLTGTQCLQTYVVMANEISWMSEERFEEAERWVPERWHLLEEEHPLHSAPLPDDFTRQLLLQQIAVLVAKVVRHFSVEYHYGPIGTRGRFLALPDRPFKLRVVERAQ